MSKNQKWKKCLQLFLTFFKIGAFTFGGGYAMIPLIQKEVVENKKWVSDDDILEIIAIAESTPGPIAINTATFIGCRTAGFCGAFCATLGVVIPSFIVILLIANLLKGFSDIKVVKYAFFGIRAGVLALLLKAFVGMMKKCPKTALGYSLVGLAFIGSVCGVNVLLLLVSAALIGLVSSWIAMNKEGQQ